MKIEPGGRGRRAGLAVVALVAVLVGSVAVLGAIGPLQGPSGDEVLEHVEERYDAAETVTSTATVTVANATGSATSTVEIAAASDDRSRVVVSRNGATYRMGTNGDVVWTVGPNRSAAWPVEAVTGEDGDRPSGPATVEKPMPERHGRPVAPDGMPPVNASNVTATVVGTPTVDGTSTYEVELSHPDGDGTASLWVSQEDHSVVRSVATDGTNRTEVSVESTAFNVSIHDSTFDPPSDRIAVSALDQYDGFEAAQSQTDLTLPRLDATFEEATVTVRQNVQIVSQHYVRGDETVRVLSTSAGDDRFDRLTANASTQTVGEQTVAVATARDRAVAAWTEGGVTSAVVVDGSRDEAAAIAEDLLA